MVKTKNSKRVEGLDRGTDLECMRLIPHLVGGSSRLRSGGEAYLRVGSIKYRVETLPSRSRQGNQIREMKGEEKIA